MTLKHNLEREREREREKERERERKKGALRPINANRLYTDE